MALEELLSHPRFLGYYEPIFTLSELLFLKKSKPKSFLHMFMKFMLLFSLLCFALE